MINDRWKNYTENYFDRDDVVEKLLNNNLNEIDSICDLGCGNQTLRDYFEENNIKYIPVDLYTRSKDTIICDFNNEFHNQKVDCSLVLGVFEYIQQLNSFISHIEDSTKKIIVCSFWSLTADKPNIEVREKYYGWINHLSKDDFVSLFKKFDVMEEQLLRECSIFLMRSKG